MYTLWNVLTKKWFFKLLAEIFKNKKLIKKMKKTIPKYMLLDHVDSFGHFFKFFVQKHFFLPLFKKGAKVLFLALSQKYSSLWIALAKIV